MRIGRYEVELLLGEGGMSRVYLARDPVVRRQVAVKVLRDDLGLTDKERSDLADRVREEARAAATLSHPVFASLFDMGDDEVAGIYLVHELVRGPTLRERLHGGPLAPGEVAPIARVLGAALTHAHAAGLTHRGLAPENVMLAATGIKVTDFGILQPRYARPAYTAPEAIASGAYGAASDQFSLAATLYEALTGKRAFPGDDRQAVAASVAAGTVLPPRKVLPGLRGFLRLDLVLAQALSPAPSKRFPTCEAFGAALSGELDGPRVTFLATPGPVRSSLTRATRRWQNTLAIIAVAVIAGLLLYGRLRQAFSVQRVGSGAEAPIHSSASPAQPGSATSPGPAQPSGRRPSPEPTVAP